LPSFHSQEQLSLDRLRKVGNLVQEERSFMCFPKEAGGAACRPSESTALMTEERRLRQRRSDGSAVSFNKGSLSPWAVPVDFTRDMRLARPPFAEQEYWVGRVGQRSEMLHEFCHHAAPADD
jgi:hypothetical protein